jgi:magnesium chelatase family protein
MDNNSLQKFCHLDGKCTALLEKAMNRFELSARAYFRIIKLSRTIADLEKSGEINASHISEALQYRSKQSV